MYLDDLIVFLFAYAIFSFLLSMIPIKIGQDRNVSDMQTLKNLSYGSILMPLLWLFAVGFACFSDRD